MAGTGHPSTKGAARGWQWHRVALPHCCASVDERLKHEDLFDAAIVAISLESNSEAAAGFIVCGKPRLFEQPLAMSVAEATGVPAMTSAPEAHAVGYSRRFYSSVRAAADYSRARPHDVLRRLRSAGNRSSRNETSRQPASGLCKPDRLGQRHSCALRVTLGQCRTLGRVVLFRHAYTNRIDLRENPYLLEHGGRMRNVPPSPEDTYARAGTRLQDFVFLMRLWMTARSPRRILRSTTRLPRWASRKTWLFRR